MCGPRKRLFTVHNLTCPMRRIRLASCCRALRACTLSSSSLWGSVSPRLDSKPAYYDSLAAWLAAHKGGLQTLWFMSGSKGETAAAVVPRLLRSMAGGTLADLELRDVPAGADTQALAQLQLTRLRMVGCSSKALPSELAALPLAELELTVCPHLTTDAALAPLAHLRASLTSLKLQYCHMVGRIPAPLRALSTLRALELELNADRATMWPLPPPAPDAFAPPACLTALTSLKLWGWGFPVLPAELSAMHGLKVRTPAAYLPVNGKAGCCWTQLPGTLHAGVACAACPTSRLCLPSHRMPAGR